MKQESRSELMARVQELCFACLDLNLYLDNNPDDSNAVSMYNKLSNQFEQARCAYESRYGPLTNFGYAQSRCPWQWVDQPWPWDREFNC